jgi:hypothetical protein
MIGLYVSLKWLLLVKFKIFIVIILGFNFKVFFEIEQL